MPVYEAMKGKLNWAIMAKKRQVQFSVTDSIGFFGSSPSPQNTVTTGKLMSPKVLFTRLFIYCVALFYYRSFEGSVCAN